jgi:predicted ribonuclease YlaK
MDMLIGDPDVLNPDEITPNTKKKADYLCVPIQYLDKLGEWRHELSSRGEASKRLIDSMGRMLYYLNNHPNDDNAFKTENGMKIMFREVPQAHEAHSTALAIALGQELKTGHSNSKKGGSVAIMTGSDWMVAKASAAHIDIARINPEIYTGRSKVMLPPDAVSLWTKNHHISDAEWHDIFPNRQIHYNEFVEFEIENHGQTQTGYSNIGRYTFDEHGNPAIIPLKYVKFSSPTYRNIRPITNVQAMYMEALLAPVDEIPIVVFSGLFGTGKTFLAVAAGLNGVGYRTTKPNVPYDRIFICPRDSALGKDIGFLPGGLPDKTMPMAMPIIDNIYDVLKIIRDTPGTKTSSDDEIDQIISHDGDMEHGKSAKKRSKKRPKTTEDEAAMLRKTGFGNISKEVLDITSQYFEFQPLIYMGGRSISNALIYYDEFQDVERFQARELVSRIGHGSKIVITGDPTQLSNPHLNRTSNGLNYIGNKLADKPYAAVIGCNEEDEIVRHWVLREIAKALK